MVQLIIKRYAAAWQLGAKSEKPKNRLPGYEGLRPKAQEFEKAEVHAC